MDDIGSTDAALVCNTNVRSPSVLEETGLLLMEKEWGVVKGIVRFQDL